MGDRNKPNVAFGSEFTSRMAQHPRVAYYPYPRPCPILVTMIGDELLVGARAAADKKVTAKLAALHAEDTGFTVFGGIKKQNNAKLPEDVQIWRLTKPGNGPHADVAEAVWSARKTLRAQKIPVEQVAPNHVLIPAPDYHACPSDAPDPVLGVGIALPPKTGGVKVTVIDSGYVPRGPIVKRVSAVYGHWFDRKKGWLPEKMTSAPGLDPLDENHDHKLDALVGHANFVAGVIARACAAAEITVVSHNGSFVKRDVGTRPIPTEASVARSLWEYGDADVVNIGFAFTTLPNAALVHNRTPPGPPSWTFGMVLGALQKQGSVMVVAPAGNQGWNTLQYPAGFPSVIGVGSLMRDGKTKSAFSNYGPWVDCSTEGQHVISTFITGWANRQTEEKEPPNSSGVRLQPRKSFTSGWAAWSGTSFAAPKVAAAIANAKAGTSKTPAQAWDTVKKVFAGASAAKIAGMGIVMRALPPG